MSNKTRKNKMEVYMRCGFSENVFWSILRMHPVCMALSEKKQMTKMNFLVCKKGWQSAHVARDPVIIWKGKKYAGAKMAAELESSLMEINDQEAHDREGDMIDEAVISTHKAEKKLNSLVKGQQVSQTDKETSVLDATFMQPSSTPKLSKVEVLAYRRRRQTQQSSSVNLPFVTNGSSIVKVTLDQKDKLQLKWIRDAKRNVGDLSNIDVFKMGSCFLKRHELANLLKQRGQLSDWVMHELSRFLTKDGLHWTPPIRRIVLSPYLSARLLENADSNTFSEVEKNVILAAARKLREDKESGGLDIKNCSFVFLPILFGNHWFTYCFSLHHCTIVKFNSLPQMNDERKIHDRLVTAVQALFISYDASWHIDCTGWAVMDAGMPQQKDIHSCGIFMVTAIDNWNEGWKSGFPFQGEAIQMRETFVLKLLNHELNEAKWNVLKAVSDAQIPQRSRCRGDSRISQDPKWQQTGPYVKYATKGFKKSKTYSSTEEDITYLGS